MPGCRWQLWLLSIWQTLRTVPRETSRAVQVTWQGARDVITQTIDDGVVSMRTAADEARMAATRSRAAAENDDGRPCPNVSAQMPLKVAQGMPSLHRSGRVLLTTVRKSPALTCMLELQACWRYSGELTSGRSPSTYSMKNATAAH